MMPKLVAIGMLALALVILAPTASADDGAAEVCQKQSSGTYESEDCVVKGYNGGICIFYHYDNANGGHESCGHFVKP